MVALQFARSPADAVAVPISDQRRSSLSSDKRQVDDAEESDQNNG